MQTSPLAVACPAALLAAGLATMAGASPLPDPQGGADRRIVTIRGIVVDDETGSPIASFSIQPGRSDADDPSKVAWGHPRRVPGSGTIVDGRTIPDPNPRGEFSTYVDLDADEANRMDRHRILADGYEPEPVLDRPPGPADAGTTVEVTLRLRRGEAIVGRVVDHAGRPAAGATLCPIRPGWDTLRIVDDVIGEGTDTGLLDPSVTRALADEEGRFRITGVGDATLIAVSAPTLHFWTVPVPPPGEELAIHLPEPASLRIPFSIGGDPGEAHIWMKLAVPEHLERQVSVTRNVEIPNGGQAVRLDLSPGEYTLWRNKMLPVGDHLSETPLEMRKLDARSGEPAVVSFVYRGETPISGMVSVPLGEAYSLLFVAIEPMPRPEPDPARLFFPPPRYIDMVPCGEGGRFQTADLPPGDYVVHAAGYRTRPRYDRPFMTINDAPDGIGSARVALPEGGPPPEVRIELEGRDRP